jgi:GNAT superfamily N-acetyltransferase
VVTLRYLLETSMPPRSKQIEMTFEEFSLLPQEFGWKHEYFDGKAWIRPSEWHVFLEVEVPRTDASVSSAIQPLRSEDAEALIDAFRETFESSVEFCDYSDEQFRSFASKRVAGVLAGRDGALDPSSRVAVDERVSSIDGAAFIRRSKSAPVLELLYVRPNRQRQGVGKEILDAVFAALRAQGDTILRSSHHVCNVGSAAWHRRMGFYELDDLMLAGKRHRWWTGEAWRREETGDNVGAAEARQHEAVWRAKVDELEARKDREGWDAVTPIRMF